MLLITLLQTLRCPLAELRTAMGAYSIANCNDHFEIVVFCFIFFPSFVVMPLILTFVLTKPTAPSFLNNHKIKTVLLKKRQQNCFFIFRTCIVLDSFLSFIKIFLHDKNVDFPYGHFTKYHLLVNLP